MGIRTTIPGATAIKDDYSTFTADLPKMCRLVHQDPETLILNDYALHVTEWFEAIYGMESGSTD